MSLSNGKPKETSPLSRSIFLALACIMVIFFAAGCKTFKPVEDLTRYYILSPSATATTPARTNESIAIGIAPVEIPAYLQTSRIVIRRGTNEIHYSQSGDWAEPLTKGFQRVLAADLAIFAPGTKTITSVWQSRDVKAEVQIIIERFDLDEAGQATLDCKWRVDSPNAQTLHSDRAFIIKKGPAAATNPAAAVSTLSEAIAELSKKIAASLPAS